MVIPSNRLIGICCRIGICSEKGVVLFPKVTKMGSIIGHWLWGWDSERPVAQTQQKLTLGFRGKEMGGR